VLNSTRWLWYVVLLVFAGFILKPGLPLQLGLLSVELDLSTFDNPYTHHPASTVHVLYVAGLILLRHPILRILSGGIDAADVINIVGIAYQAERFADSYHWASTTDFRVALRVQVYALYAFLSFE